MQEELISIIVPIYNVEKYLKKCIDSILNQTYSNIEVILVDDGSPDNSGLICDNYAKKDKRIRVIHKKNGGLSDARNEGIKIAKGKYIGFVDSDDYIKKDMYEYLYNLISTLHCDISICNFIKVYEEENLENNIAFSNKKKELNSSEAIQYLLDDREIKSFAWNKLYKKDLFYDIKYPKNMNMEDVATTYKLFSKAKKIVVGNEEKYFYIQREGSILRSKNSKYYIDYFEIFYERYNYIKKKYTKIYNNDIVMLNFILSLCLIEDKNVEIFIKKNRIINILKKVYADIKKSRFKINNKTKIRYYTLIFSYSLYKVIFRGYIKWVVKLKTRELL